MRFTKKHIDKFFEYGMLLQVSLIGTFKSYVNENYDGGGIRVLNHLTGTNTFFLHGPANSKSEMITVDKKHSLHQLIVEHLIARKLSI